jgi:hypothetical protein
MIRYDISPSAIYGYKARQDLGINHILVAFLDAWQYNRSDSIGSGGKYENSDQAQAFTPRDILGSPGAAGPEFGLPRGMQ